MRHFLKTRTTKAIIILGICLAVVILFLDYHGANHQPSGAYEWHIQYGSVVSNSRSLFMSSISNYHSLAISPSGNLFTTSSEPGAYRSSDNGATWELISKGIKDCYINTIAADNNDRIYLGTGRGLYESSGKLDHWKLLDIGSPIALSVERIFVDGKNNIYAVCRSTQEDRYVYKSQEGTGRWNLIWGGPGKRQDVRSILVANAKATLNRRAISKKQAAILIGTGYGELYRSNDDGLHWANLTSNLKLKKRLGNSSITIDSVIADSKGSIYLSATAETYADRNIQRSASILKSDDEGNTWKKLAVPEGDPPVCLAAGTNGILLLGNRNGSIYVSKNGGKSWNLSQRPPLINRLSGEPGVTAMAIDGDGNAYVATYSYFLYGRHRN